MRRRTGYAVGSLVAAALFAACGDSSTPSQGNSSRSPADVEVHAIDTLKFDRDAFAAKAGDVRIEYANDGVLTHTLLIDGVRGFKLDVTGKGDTRTTSIALAAGTYTIFCDVPGHSTMKAQLSVNP